MKRKLLLCLSLLLLTGCAGEASMTLTPKKLKTQTENVLHILNWNGKFYDFQGREPIKQATFQTWSLTKDGAWEPIGTPEELMHEKSKASFALSVGNDIRDGYNVAVADDAFGKRQFRTCRKKHCYHALGTAHLLDRWRRGCIRTADTAFVPDGCCVLL